VNEHCILGLDIGGANLKAATADRRAVSVPFPLWKDKDNLGRQLRRLVDRFPEAESFAVTMTGELCDCYETSAEGVAHILDAVRGSVRSFPTHVWSTKGTFLTVDAAKSNPMLVAAANWHATASWAGRFVSRGVGLLLDIGSTTTDLITLFDGEVRTQGKTDVERLENGELIYTGIGRTPAATLLPAGRHASELFATVQDAYLLLKRIAEQPENANTADGRPATRDHAHGRMARMLGGDRLQTSPDATETLAETMIANQWSLLFDAVAKQAVAMRGNRIASLDPDKQIAITCGSGEFLALQLATAVRPTFTDVISLGDHLGPELAECAPAYAVAVLAQERGL